MIMVMMIIPALTCACQSLFKVMVMAVTAWSNSGGWWLLALTVSLSVDGKDGGE